MKFWWSFDGGKGPSNFKQITKTELKIVIGEYCNILNQYTSFDRPLSNNFHLYIKRKINEKPLDVTLAKLSSYAIEAARKTYGNVAFTGDVVDILIERLKSIDLQESIRNIDPYA